MLLASRRFILRVIFLLFAILLHVLAFTAATSSSNGLLLARDDDPSTSSTDSHCIELTENDRSIIHTVDQTLQTFSNREKFSVFLKGINKVQVTAAFATIIGEATLGKLLLQEDMPMMDQMMAVPTIIVALLGGVNALAGAINLNIMGKWRGPAGLELISFGSQISIWTVCILLMFQILIMTAYMGVPVFENYSKALAVHSSFWSLTLAQGAWEIAKNHQLSAGTGKLMDSLKLNGWRASAKAKRMMRGFINFSSRIFQRQINYVDQSSDDAIKLDHYVPLTRELARMAIEVGAVGQCVEDSFNFHIRTSQFQQGQKSPDQCRLEWKDKFGHIYQNSGPAHDFEDIQVGNLAEMIRLTTLQDITGDRDKKPNGMLQAIELNMIGHMVPAIFFGTLLCVSGGNSIDFGTLAGNGLYGALFVMQALYFHKSSQALLNMFRAMTIDNPKANELITNVRQELRNGELKEWGNRGVEIFLMVLTSKIREYDRHQGRFFIHNCPIHMQEALKTKLLDMSRKFRVLPPEVYADTPDNVLGDMFRFSSDRTTRRPLRNVRRDQGRARVMTWRIFNEWYKDVDIGNLWERIRLKQDECVKSKEEEVSKHS